MQRYNIALVPVDKSVRDSIAAISQKFFGKIHDHYILGENGMAHVTLCQFYASSPDLAREVYNKFLLSVVNVPEVQIESFQIRAGTLINAGKFIVEYSVRRDDTLVQLQKECAFLLAALGFENQTPSDRYAPHFTLARLSEPCANVPDVEDAPAGFYAMDLRLGLTSETGVFVKDVSNP